MSRSLRPIFARLFALLFLPLLACRAVPAGDPGTEHAGTPFVLVLLRTGPADLEGEEREAAFAGHFANMERLAEEGYLLAAGPLGEPPAEPDHRGLFLLDVESLAEALDLAGTDPAVRAGVFVLEAWPLRSRWDLRSVLAVDRAAAEREEFSMRGYVLALVPDHALALERLAPWVADGRAGVDARLGGERTGQGLFLLHTDSVREAEEWLEEAGTSSRWLMPWWGSASLERLRAP